MSLDLLDATKNPATSTLRADEAKNSSEIGRKKLADDFDEFMLLLTTQLQNQDPTEPLDTNQFTEQLVQFSSVEQAVQTNSNLEKLLSLTTNNQVNSAVSFIGKVVDTQGSTSFLENGEAEFTYEVPAGAANVTLSVLDASGKAVYTTAAPNSSGQHTFVWDGINSFNGKQMTDGLYTFGILAKDAKGQALDGKTFTSGRVTAVAMDGEELTLTLNNVLDVPMDKILSVREPIINTQIAQQ
jgi:flagellar basal-body rod modification protein FlgD